MSCKHWTDCGVKRGGCCALNLYGGRPSLGTCERCPSYDGPARGIGDVVATITKAVGVKPCPKCSERRAKWNGWLQL